MRPLACQGIPVTDCHRQLKDFLIQNQSLLFQNGMLNAGSFLAEPMSDDKTGLIDWYVEGTVPPKPYSSLSQEDQDRVRKLIETYAVGFQALLDAQETSNPMATEMLTLALQHPCKDDIYVLDGLPVLINWGFKDGSSGAVPENIIAMGPGHGRPVPPRPEVQAGPAPEPAMRPVPGAVPVPPAAPVPGPQAASTSTRIFSLGCLPWLLPLLLLLLLLWLLLAFLGRLPVPLPGSLFQPYASHSAGAGSQPYAAPGAGGAGAEPSIYPDAESDRAQKLYERYQVLLDRLTQHAALCVPPKKELPKAQPAVPPAVTPVPEKPVPEEPAKPVEPAPAIDFSGDKPQETGPLAEAEMPNFGTPVEPPAEPETPKNSPKKGERMAIPDNAAKKKDFSFLKGCWESKTGMARTTDGSEVVVEFCFNKKGRGSVIVHEVGDGRGEKCKGSASARFKGDTLYIQSGVAYCPHGGGYSEQTVVCTGSGSSTYCNGHSQNINWKALFRRK